jgi:hypothetical protein
MPQLNKDDAWEIEKKLRRKAPKAPGREKFSISQFEGGSHTWVVVDYRGRRLAEFGIKRGSRRDAGHGWIPDQLHLSPHEASELAQCPLTVDEYINLMVQRGFIVEPPSDSGGTAVAAPVSVPP